MVALLKFSNFVEFPLKVCKVFGAIPYEKKNQKISDRKKKFLKIYFTLQMILFNIWIPLSVVYISKNTKNLVKISQNLVADVVAMLSVAKAVSVFLNKEQFKDTIETLSDLFPMTKIDQEINAVKKYFKSYKRMERIFAGFAFFNFANLIITQFVKVAVTGNWIQKFPYETWLPFDIYNPWVYNFVLVEFFNNFFIGTVTFLGPDLLLYGFITNVLMQFDILCREIVDLKNIPLSKVEEQFAELVEKQITLIRLCKNLEKIYSASILTNILASSIIACLLGFHITENVSNDILFEFSAALIVAFAQIFLLCFYGNKLTAASEDVAKAAYDSGWHEIQNKSVKKGFVLMMQRSQRPTVLKGLKFIAVSLATFTTVKFK
jgi:hypothetical protein